MKVSVIQQEVTLETIDCCSCGVLYAAPDTFLAQRRKDGVPFYCPSGHSQSFTKSDAARAKELQAQLDQQKIKLSQAEASSRNWREWGNQQQDQKEALDRRLSATRGVVTRMKNRVANGVCPCCNRSFANLHRHMSNQHPRWKESEV